MEDSSEPANQRRARLRVTRPRWGEVGAEVVVIYPGPPVPSEGRLRELGDGPWGYHLKVGQSWRFWGEVDGQGLARPVYLGLDHPKKPPPSGLRFQAVVKGAIYDDRTSPQRFSVKVEHVEKGPCVEGSEMLVVGNCPGQARRGERLMISAEPYPHPILDTSQGNIQTCSWWQNDMVKGKVTELSEGWVTLAGPVELLYPYQAYSPVVEGMTVNLALQSTPWK